MPIIATLTAKPTDTAALPLTCHGRLSDELAHEAAVRRQVRETTLAAKEEARFSRVIAKHAARSHSQSLLFRVLDYWRRDNSRNSVSKIAEHNQANRKHRNTQGRFSDVTPSSRRMSFLRMLAYQFGIG